MTYSEALEFLASLDAFGIKPGLERVRRLCGLAGEPQEGYPSVLVAGTNGKGSTCAFLSAVLQAAGLRVGSSPKPHLHTPRERLQVNGALCSEEEFAALVETVASWLRQVGADPAAGAPTYFEAMTLMALLHFARQGVDVAVVEVGLGGRLDATNVLAPRVSVITNIGLDHVDRLGDTVEAIAAEKAGILRPAVPAVTGAQGGALRVIEESAARLGAPLWRRGTEIRARRVEASEAGSRFDLATPAGEWEGLSVGMAGTHQVANASLAVAAALRLGEAGIPVGEAAVRKGLARTRMPGRLERLSERPLVLIDAAHNPDAARQLVPTLRELYLKGHPERRLLLVVGLSEAHQPEEMAAILAPAADLLVATASTHRQATPAARVAELARPHLRPGAELRVAASVPEAVRVATSLAGEEDLVCVTGSIFAIGEVEPNPRPLPHPQAGTRGRGA